MLALRVGMYYNNCAVIGTSKAQCRRKKADVAEWQTQTTQNRSGNHVGSSPTIGTRKMHGTVEKVPCIFCFDRTFDRILFQKLRE